MTGGEARAIILEHVQSEIARLSAVSATHKGPGRPSPAEIREMFAARDAREGVVKYAPSRWLRRTLTVPEKKCMSRELEAM